MRPAWKCRYNHFSTQHRRCCYKINMHRDIYSRAYWSCYPTIQNLNRWRRVWICLSWHFAWRWGSGCKGPVCHIYPGNAGIWKWGPYESPNCFLLSLIRYPNFFLILIENVNLLSIFIPFQFLPVYSIIINFVWIKLLDTI